MATRNRKVEVYKLTISGLDQGTSYGDFLYKIRQRVKRLDCAVLELGSRSHALFDIRVVNRRTRMRFISYTTGHRPDILDTTRFSIEPNPLPETQTGVEWTHVLGGRLPDKRYVLYLEKVIGGIWPSTLEDYLQWLIDDYHEDPNGAAVDEPVTVSVEAVPGPEFIERMDSLDRITRATVRLVRPNPGFADLKTELARESGESDAHKSDVVMTARRNASLRRNSGIIAAIRSLWEGNRLDYAAIEGTRQGVRDQFNTMKLGLSYLVPLELDQNGQVDHNGAWRALSKMMDEMAGDVQ